MKPKHQRLTFISVALLLMAGAAWMVLSAFEDNLVFFYSPSDLAAKPPAINQPIRIGGMVQDDSVKDSTGVAGGFISFIVTDYAETIDVTFDGTLPALFREGQGVVVEGSLNAQGSFIATRVLAKHDENYMPPEVVDALEDAGQWKQHYNKDESAQ